MSATALRHVKVIPDTAPRGQHADRRSGWTPQEREDLDDPCHDTRYRDHCCDASSILCESTSFCPSVYRPVQHGDNLVLNWACHYSQPTHSSSSPWSKMHSQSTTFCPPCTRCTAPLRGRSSDWSRYQVRKQTSRRTTEPPANSSLHRSEKCLIRVDSAAQQWICRMGIDQHFHGIPLCSQ